MGISTPIQWTDSTCNPTMGCDGCELWGGQRHSCYAGIQHGFRGASNPGFSPRFEILTYHRGRMVTAAGWPCLRGRVRDDGPWKDGLPRMIFVSDMSDALSKDVPFEYLLTEVIDVVGSEMGQRHIWQWLTKRPGRMAEFATWLEKLGVSWPANLWAGTSITTSLTQSRIAELVKVPATVRFLSVEPQIEDIDLEGRLDGIHWLIQGGESGQGARRFDVEWADRLRQQCQDAGVAYFMKQLGAAAFENGEPHDLRHGHGGDWSEWHERLRVREFPVIEV
jgi:protein gp37